MRTRIISALVAIPLFLYVIIKGGLTLRLAVLFLAFMAANEFFNAFKNIDIYGSKPIAIFAIISMFLITLKEIDQKLIMAWFFIIMIATFINTIFNRKLNPLSSAITMLGVCYVIFFMYHIVFIVNCSKYNYLIWLVFIVAWATDTFAYFSGYIFGKRKLCPNISPKKTIEGAIGGILGSILMSFLFAYFFASEVTYHCMIIGFIGSILGQFGDLTASMFKRYVGIKDYGNIMPGHGGVLDRFDSILFTAPTVYYYINLFIK
ncbi:phosphatidate cytidylyltransferase [Lutibacter sp. B2]|nr:phosphatidate cytidylyltransferase [Lutibacter sp. B2]